MGKGKRLKKEKSEGVRSTSKRWNEVKLGMRLVIPTFEQVKMGITPFLIPIPSKSKKVKADDE